MKEFDKPAAVPGIENLGEKSGTINLEVNKIYSIKITGAASFVLPTPEDKNIFNQIKIMAAITGTPSIDWGTSIFFNKTTPETGGGNYDIYFDYDNLLNNWVCGILPKGAA